jgi:hypothetical protein
MICMLASSASIGSSKGVANVLGVDKWNIIKALEWWVQLDTQQDAIWVNRKRRRHFMPFCIYERQFWTTHTTNFPNWKDVRRIFVNQNENNVSHHLQVSWVWFSYTNYHLDGQWKKNGHEVLFKFSRVLCLLNYVSCCSLTQLLLLVILVCCLSKIVLCSLKGFTMSVALM